jgi:hypothetical protein
MKKYSFILATVLCLLNCATLLTAQVIISSCTNNVVLDINGATTMSAINNTGNIIKLLIEAKGGGGGRGKDYNGIIPGGEGAILTGEFDLAPNATVFAISGGKGPDFNSIFNSTPSFFAGGGGGGAGVVNCGNPSDCANGTILIVAAAGTGGAENQTGLGGSVTNMACGNGGLAGTAAGGGGCLSDGGASSTSTGGGQILKTGLSTEGVTIGCYPCTNGAKGMGGGGASNVSYGGGGGGATGGNGSNTVAATSYNTLTSATNTAGLDNIGGTTGYVKITCINPSLPIELISFRAALRNDAVQLFWETATEKNNKGFQIERSLDGKNWSTIAFVESVGNSTTIQRYQYTDINNLNTVTYYRLKQIDSDEKASYSKIININTSGNAPVKIQLNTTQTLLTVFSEVTTEYCIYAISGQPVLFGQLTDNFTDIDISSLAPALYILKMPIGTIRFVKY